MSRPTLLRLHFAASGKTIRAFARFHGCSDAWAYRCIRGQHPAPRRFRSDLAEFLGQPEEILFPDAQKKDAGSTKPAPIQKGDHSDVTSSPRP